MKAVIVVIAITLLVSVGMFSLIGASAESQLNGHPFRHEHEFRETTSRPGVAYCIHCLGTAPMFKLSLVDKEGTEK